MSAVELQVQAKALGDPTRYRIFRYVADETDPVGVAELTEHLGLNHNAIRQHLARLVAAELVTESVAPASGQGRPGLTTGCIRTPRAKWGVPGPYEQLSPGSRRSSEPGTPPSRSVTASGRGRQLGAGAAEDPAGAVVDQMALQRVRADHPPGKEHRRDHAHTPLPSCPPSSPIRTPCARSARGIATGVAETAGGIVVDELITKDPRGGRLSPALPRDRRRRRFGVALGPRR
ncbi:MAG: winged helix-turn-helix domain-containing protein [Acidimicrobiales bacterium]